jgi:putative effector of murein hydrolase
VSLAPKWVTARIAMGISEQIGGTPGLTAVLGTYVLNLLRVRNWRGRGLAVGIAAHGIGMARAFQVNEIAGAFASLAMGLNGIATAILVPLALRLLS